jgi:hypothetical protein
LRPWIVKRRAVDDILTEAAALPHVRVLGLPPEEKYLLFGESVCTTGCRITVSLTDVPKAWCQGT